jgi:hypothetical protein
LSKNKDYIAKTQDYIPKTAKAKETGSIAHGLEALSSITNIRKTNKQQQKIHERNQRTEKYRKASCLHRLEKSILLKCSYYQKQSTDLIQSLSNHYQLALLSEQEKTILKFVWTQTYTHPKPW